MADDGSLSQLDENANRTIQIDALSDELVEEYLSRSSEQAPSVAPPPLPRRRGRARSIAIGVAVALLAAGLGIAAASYLGGSSPAAAPAASASDAPAVELDAVLIEAGD